MQPEEETIVMEMRKNAQDCAVCIEYTASKSIEEKEVLRHQRHHAFSDDQRSASVDIFLSS